MSISRRDFLRLSALGLGSSLLAACGGKIQSTNATPQAPTTTLQPLPTFTAAATGQPGLISTEILGRPTDQAVTVNVIPAKKSELFFEFGTVRGKYGTQTSVVPASAGLPVNAIIDGLQPNTRYYYRTRFKEKEADAFTAGVEHTFVTQRAPGEPFTFTIDSDPHNHDPNFNAELYSLTLANALKDLPDFHINLGDTFMTEKLKIKNLEEVISSYSDFRPMLGKIAADAPLFLVNGNHEGELGWLLDGSDHNLAIWCAETRQKYYPNPVPNRFYSGSTTQEEFIGIRDGYYAWKWGDALFVALDPFWYTRSKPISQPDNNWEWTLGKAQYDWLKQTIETSNAKFKFIFIHNLVGGSNKDGRGGIEAAGYYEWGGQNQDGSWGFDTHRPGWEMPIHQLMVKNGVNVLFHGHDHVFVKQTLDGIVYQECPQPSITRYNNTHLAQDYGYVDGDVVSSSGHLRVSVTTEQAVVEYVRAYLPQDVNSSQKNGTVDFSYVIS